MNYKISVVIPHYNSYEYLKKCISSIPENEAIQVIVVDDDSPDFNLYRQELTLSHNIEFVALSVNKGAGAARNAGLQLARGEWLLFADADDYFLPGAFETFMKACNDNADIVYFKTSSVDIATGLQSDRHVSFNQYIDDYLNNSNSIIAENNIRFRWYVPYAKMVRRKLVIDNNITFDEVRYSNDIMFSAKIGYYASKIAVEDVKVYCITTSSGSLSRSMSKEALMCRYNVTIQYNKFLKEIKQNPYQAIVLRYFILALKYHASCIIPMMKILIKEDVSIFAGLHRWKQIFDKQRRQLKHF